MSTITEPSPLPREEQQPADDRPKADASMLEDQFPDWLKVSRGVTILTGVIGIIYFCLARLAIRNTDVWGHLAYGRWIIEHGRLPRTEPLMTLSQGVPWLDVAWLGKVAGLWVFDRFGVAGLQFLHAVPITFAFAVLAWAMYRQTRSTGWTIAGLFLFGAIDYQQLLIQRPQDFGLACFAITLVGGLRRVTGRSVWIGLPLMFAVWANIHGSFLVGLTVLATAAVGGGLDVLWRTRDPIRAVRSSELWRPLLLLQLCAAAALLNPAGLRIYADAVRISANPNLSVLLDWSPLTLRVPQGMAFAAGVVLLALVFRWSPRRLRTAEILLLVGFGCGTMWSVRMIVWFGCVAGYLFGVHGAAAWRAACGRGALPAPPERRGLWTVATVGLVWIFFAYSPFGLQRIHGMPQGPDEAEYFVDNVVERTPLAAVEYLHEHADNLPAGLMYNSQEWGDFLLWAGPRKFQPFVSSHVHLIPKEVWDDYLEMYDGGAFPEKFDRYGVNTVLVDTTNYMGLIRTLRDSDKWREVFQDPAGLAVLFVRNSAAPVAAGEAAAPAAEAAGH
ncbi:MAG: hypothetical protein R3B90_04545 [Planctomycetaceae bacterium]